MEFKNLNELVTGALLCASRPGANWWGRGGPASCWARKFLQPLWKLQLLLFPFLTSLISVTQGAKAWRAGAVGLSPSAVVGAGSPGARFPPLTWFTHW